ncbi:hypothetical protein BKA93DRAFT_737771 [Sparassis latifolia]
MQGSQLKKRYSAEQKKQLLANLDLEVDHKTRQLEEWLADALENFLRHQEGLISRTPRLVRDITMLEFAKYKGNVQECVKGLKREILGAEDTAIDRSTRKRKWVASQDSTERVDVKVGHDPAGVGESSRGVKSARTMPTTPQKMAGPSNGVGTAQRARFPLNKTPGTIRTIKRIPSGMNTPTRKAVTAASSKPPFFARPASPTKLPSPSKRPIRPPSSSSFNPILPAHAMQPRWPKHNESMLSVNGSPLANPYQLGLNGWLRTVSESEGTERADSDAESERGGKKLVRKASSIIVRSSGESGGHSRTNSQTSVVAPPHGTHSRANSQTNAGGFVPNRSNNVADPAPHLSLTALVSVPTKDGHILEFDPLQTSPEELDTLEGISDSAKKQAKLDIVRLVQTTVERWKIS